jgi:hypothetical protein
MVSVQVRGRVDKDGILRLQVPTAFHDTEIEACVVLNPITANGTTPESKGYPPGFFETIAGKWVGELEHEEQNEYETQALLE